jgi:hypothetical protein
VLIDLTDPLIDPVAPSPDKVQIAAQLIHLIHPFALSPRAIGRLWPAPRPDPPLDCSDSHFLT